MTPTKPTPYKVSTIETLCSVYKVCTLLFDCIEHPLLCLQSPSTLLFYYKFCTYSCIYISVLQQKPLFAAREKQTVAVATVADVGHQQEEQ